MTDMTIGVFGCDETAATSNISLKSAARLHTILPEPHRNLPRHCGESRKPARSISQVEKLQAGNRLSPLSYAHISFVMAVANFMRFHLLLASLGLAPRVQWAATKRCLVPRNRPEEGRLGICTKDV